MENGGRKREERNSREKKRRVGGERKYNWHVEKRKEKEKIKKICKKMPMKEEKGKRS